MSRSWRALPLSRVDSVNADRLGADGPLGGMRYQPGQKESTGETSTPRFRPVERYTRDEGCGVRVNRELC
jgi:hypothetical protein